MNYLLDTHVMLWLLTDPDELGITSRSIIEGGENVLYWSAASFWELTVKLSLNKLELSSDWIDQLEKEKKLNRIQDLPVHWHHCRQNERLPWHHRDPFDRLLICQALIENLTLISKDRKFREYSVPVVW